MELIASSRLSPRRVCGGQYHNCNVTRAPGSVAEVAAAADDDNDDVADIYGH